MAFLEEGEQSSLLVNDSSFPDSGGSPQHPTLTSVHQVVPAPVGLLGPALPLQIGLLVLSKEKHTPVLCRDWRAAQVWGVSWRDTQPQQMAQDTPAVSHATPRGCPGS